MDHTEFEKYVADYVEGNLPDELRRRMDQARKQNPDLDELARLHEQILTALAETPEVAFPKGLSRRILAAAEERDRMLARESRMFRRSLFFWSAIATVVTAFASALFYFFQDNFAASIGKVGAAGNASYSQRELILSALAKAPKWLSAASDLLITPVSVPGAEFALPAVYVVGIAVLAIALWYYHELECTTL